MGISTTRAPAVRNVFPAASRPLICLSKSGRSAAMRSITLSFSASAAVMQALWRTADLAHSTLWLRLLAMFSMKLDAVILQLLAHDAVGRFVLSRPARQGNRMGRADAGVRGHRPRYLPPA